jgi:hypothetical protein
MPTPESADRDLRFAEVTYRDALSNACTAEDDLTDLALDLVDSLQGANQLGFALHEFEDAYLNRPHLLPTAGMRLVRTVARFEPVAAATKEAIGHLEEHLAVALARLTIGAPIERYPLPGDAEREEAARLEDEDDARRAAEREAAAERAKKEREAAQVEARKQIALDDAEKTRRMIEAHPMPEGMPPRYASAKHAIAARFKMFDDILQLSGEQLVELARALDDIVGDAKAEPLAGAKESPRVAV